MTEKVLWPSWRFGPDGASDIFDSEAEIPKGWKDHPSKISGEPKTAPIVVGADTGSDDTDAAGWPFDASLHAATRSKTGAGLWRMKVGVNRPEPKPGFPKPALDL